MAITLEQAKALETGTTLHQVGEFNRDGTPRRWRVTSVKTWKTRPDEVEVRIKHGLYAYDKLRETDLHLVDLP